MFCKTMKIKTIVQVTPDHKPGILDIDEYVDYSEIEHDPTGVHALLMDTARKVYSAQLKTRDEAIRRGLILLGWTPPEGA